MTRPTRPAKPSRDRVVRRRLLHGVRLGLFATVVGLIASVPAEQGEADENELSPAVQEAVERWFAGGVGFGSPDPATGAVPVNGENGGRLGFMLKTLPASREIVGFSGPSDLLIAFAEGDDGPAIAGITILTSGDTEEHVAAVRDADVLNRRFIGLTWDEAVSAPPPDAVSGATLTAQAMWQSIRVRLDGDAPTVSQFGERMELAAVRELLPDAERVEPAAGLG
ncbi:MAG: FMN-binding protein, partial [Planctomycetota bacterium]